MKKLTSLQRGNVGCLLCMESVKLDKIQDYDIKIQTQRHMRSTEITFLIANFHGFCNIFVMGRVFKGIMHNFDKSKTAYLIRSIPRFIIFPLHSLSSLTYPQCLAHLLPSPISNHLIPQPTSALLQNSMTVALN